MLYNLYTKEQCLTEYEMEEYLKDKTKKFYVYILVEPETYLPIYVGKGSGNRLFHHWYNTPETDENKLKQFKLEKINREHGHILYFIHSLFNSEAMAYSQETSLQKSLGLYKEGGLLYNLHFDDKGGHTKSKKHYIDKCKSVHGDNLTLKNIFKPKDNHRSYASVICNVCSHSFDKRIDHLIGLKQGCPKCIEKVRLGKIKKARMSNLIYTEAANRWNKHYQHFRNIGYKVPKNFISVREQIEVICPEHGSHIMSARTKTPCGRCGEILRFLTIITESESGVYGFDDVMKFIMWTKNKDIVIGDYKLGYLIRRYLNED